MQWRLADDLTRFAAWLRERWIDADEAPTQLAGLYRAWRRVPQSVLSMTERLVEAWRAHPQFRPDLFPEAEEWRKSAKRMRLEMTHLRDKLQANRLDRYRVLAARLRERYVTIYVDDLDGARAAALVVDDEETPLHPIARHQRVIAAPFALRAVLRGAEPVRSAGATSRCSRCGADGAPPDDDLLWTCGDCGTVHDRDENHARNLLAAGRASATMLTGSEETARNAESSPQPTRYERMCAARKRKREAAALLSRDRSQSATPSD
jgi:hypothetical protein